MAQYGEAALRRWRPLVWPADTVRPVDDASSWVRAHAARIAESIPASGADLRTLAHQIKLDLAL